MLPSNFFKLLISTKENHSIKSKNYELLNETLKTLFKLSDFSLNKSKKISFGEFGEIIFPFYSFGNITTLELFGIDELIIFSFYLANKNKYKKVLDIGGNLGLHSILMSKLGWNVSVYEPDPIHLDLLKKNILENECCDKVTIYPFAVFNKEDIFEFTRVKGNTTGSHISGLKTKPYGELDKFKVNAVDIKNIIENVDFIKLDAEGAEVDIISSLNYDQLLKTDVMLEVSSEKNAINIFNFLEEFKDIKIFSQKNNWLPVCKIDDMPKSHKDGSLFITNKNNHFFKYEKN